MLDWRVITEHIERSETLSVEDLMRELADLRASSPEIGHEVTRYFSRKNRVNTFMRTSVSEQEKQKALLTDGTALGVWDIAEHIGSGGMGDVYKAKRNDGLYDQIAALKVIQRGDEDSLGRFEAERKRLANLEHPGISRIIDGGATQDGDPFMVMEYHDGVPIDEYVQSKDLSRRQILALFKPLCASTAYAHSKLILHRDIKANNVLVDGSSAVKLIDFGIAAAIGETKDGETGPMTIAYAAPEQLMRKASSVGSDIFALGVLLHQLLTGAPQQRNSDGSVELDHQSLNDADLAAIISKATVFDETDRYQSVTALADDIDAYLDTRPVLARNGTGLYRFKKLVKRNALASSLAAAFVMALSGGMVGSLVMATKASNEAARANKELVRAEWALARAEVREKIANSLSASLQRVFGDESNVDRLSNTLVKHWETVMQAPKTKDDDRAIISYALGDHFRARGDYKTAAHILKPWINSDYGDRELRISGKNLMSEVYLNSGDGRNAAREITGAVELYKGTFLENSPEHALAVANAAYYTHRPEEFKKAKELLRDVIDSGVSPEQELNLWSQLVELNLRTVDWPEAIEARRESIKLLDRTPNFPFVIATNIRMSEIQLKFYLAREFDGIEKQAADLIAQANETSGESTDTAHLYILKALAERESKNLAAANASIDHALELYLSYNSDKSPLRLRFQLIAVMIKVDSGDLVGAKAILADAQSSFNQGPNRWIETMQAYIVLKEQGPAAAEEVFKSANTDLKRARVYMRLNYILDEMTEAGMVWE